MLSLSTRRCAGYVTSFLYISISKWAFVPKECSQQWGHCSKARVHMNAVKSISSASKPCSSLARRNVAYCQLSWYKSSWKCITGGGGRLRTAYMTTLQAISSAPPALKETPLAPIQTGVQSYLYPLCEALISPNSCLLEGSWPLLLVVRSRESCEAESQTPW